MNVVPGSSFFQTVGGSAARPDTARPTQGATPILQAQTADEARPITPPDRGEAPARISGPPYGSRGSLVDIVA